jgi:hypothetical protein
VRGEAAVVRDDRAAERLERGVERDLAALGEADDADALGIDARMRAEQPQRGQGVGDVGRGGEPPWSVAVSRTLRGVKLSTTKVARPSAVSRSAQAASRASTPALPWAITMAGTRPDPSRGRRSVPKTTTFGAATRRARAN